MTDTRTPSPIGTPNGSSFLTSTVAIAAAAILSQVINFAATLFIARLYGPIEVGLFGLFNAVFIIVAFAASWRYEVAVITVDSDEEAEDIALFIIAAGLASAFVSVLGLILIEALPDAGGLSNPLRRALLVLPLTLILASAILAGINLCIRQRMFGRVAAHQIMLTVATAAGQIALVGTNVPGSRLVIGFVIGQIGGLVVLSARLVPALVNSARRPHPWRRLHRVASDHRAHFFYTVPFSMMAQLYLQLPVILLGSLFGTGAAGFFSLAFRTTFTPITLIPTSVAQVLFPEMARDRERLARWEPRLLAFLVGLGVLLAPAAAGLIIFGPDLYALALGEHWREAGFLAQIIIFSNLMNGLASGYDRLYFVLHRQRAALIVVCLVSLLSGLLMLAAGTIGGTAAWLVGGWAIGHLVLAFAWMITIYRIAGFSLSALMGRWAVIAATTSMLAGALACAPAAIDHQPWPVLLGLAVVAAYIGIVLCIFRPLWSLLGRCRMNSS